MKGQVMRKLHTRSCAIQIIMKSSHFCPGCYVFSCQVWNLCLFVTEEASSLFTTETIPQCTSENGDCLLKLKAQTVAIRSLLFLVLHYLCNCIWQPPEYYFNLLPIETVPSHFMSKWKLIHSFMFPVSVAGPHLFRTYCSCSYLSTTDHVWEKSLQKNSFLPSTISSHEAVIVYALLLVHDSSVFLKEWGFKWQTL